jgi:two-component system sensor histidine kinase ChvG
LAVNLLVLLIPVVGLEFARTYERQLLDGLERDMLNQSVLLCSLLEATLSSGATLNESELESTLSRAARQTRTRIRIVLPERGVVADSHRHGPPEGKEARPRFYQSARLGSDVASTLLRRGYEEEVTPILERAELRAALAGTRQTRTRLARNPPAVFLFLAEPIRFAGNVFGAVYITRSTAPVIDELHRIRHSLSVVLLIAGGISALLTLALSFTISRPLARLARAARRIAGGDTAVEIPSGGGGEIGELAMAFGDMTQKLEARQRYILDFAADVAHEFKSPLTSIRGAAELLSEGAADDPEARRRFLCNIGLDAERLDRLVTRLLELSRIEASAAPPAPVVVEALVRRVVERLQHDSVIELRYESSIPLIRGREMDLEAALLNLLENALRFSPPNEPVVVAVQGRPSDAEIVICVTDLGPGIAPEHRARLFERFFTTEGERNGTGLGLAIVKSVVVAHGGSVELLDGGAPGTTFRVRLPIGFSSRKKS